MTPYSTIPKKFFDFHFFYFCFHFIIHHSSFIIHFISFHSIKWYPFKSSKWIRTTFCTTLCATFQGRWNRGKRRSKMCVGQFLPGWYRSKALKNDTLWCYSCGSRSVCISSVPKCSFGSLCGAYHAYSTISSEATGNWIFLGGFSSCATVPTVLTALSYDDREWKWRLDCEEPHFEFLIHMFPQQNIAKHFRLSVWHLKIF